MKNKVMLALVLICFMLSFTAIAQASLGDSLLKVGSRGTDVVELQTKLNNLGYNVGKADGIFGPMTKEGVMNFQKAHSLAVDGIVGPMTVKSLNNAYLPKQPQAKVTNIISTAKKYLGVRYQWGGSTPQTGFDCSGFVAYVFQQNGITLPRVSRDQYTVGTKVSFDNLQPGDLVFFSFAGNGVVDHDGIYLGGGEFINASSSKGVTIYSLGPYWKSVYVGAKRVI
ncbi:NlpC/P60 family protein [Desulfosporosinus youngiae]|uniref:Cell wall-associated hydrolase, invasion-associated protein n=1 Tax=Desulfosporosinus youngiae DSM 17734 TaxID=768710 RepID=H5Y0P5_9FIRM|nr:NlpC/P60 family protein [Desulfosporosinus youngiae]EHQ92301.1 cell wall-associated hydrolase, invasion-associated protein [Desulfosporosinus youngiae DSM 17734]